MAVLVKGKIHLLISYPFLNSYYFYLKAVQVVFPLVGLTVTMETNTGELVAFTIRT